MKVTYVSACLDSSGYAEAARNNIAALNSVGVDITVVPVSFEQQKSGLGKLGQLVDQLTKKSADSKIEILHVTPNLYSRLCKGNKYTIGYAAWETSILPADWVAAVNLLDEVWVPSKHNIEAFKRGGVTIPIIHIPHTFDMDRGASLQTILENKKADDFAFYSIFQWLERKNPVGLIKAYLTEFKETEDVILVLKTFVITPGNQAEVEQIKKKIQMVKKALYLSSYPRMLLIANLLSRDQVASLHADGDCYVSLHRCEGFGIPIAEAMLASNPTIVTGYGGPADFIKHEKTGYLVDYLHTPVSNMPWDMYKGSAVWAEPDLMHARKLMREVFENKQQAREMGKKAKSWMKKNLSWKAVGEKMKARLEEIPNGH